MKQLQNESGAYMLEVLIALFLFGLSMMGLAQLGYASMLGNKTSQMMTDATALAQDRLEYSKQVGYDAVDAIAGKESYGSIPGYRKYRRETIVVTKGQLKEVSVLVYWDKDRHHFELRTALSP